MKDCFGSPLPLQILDAVGECVDPRRRSLLHKPQSLTPRRSMTSHSFIHYSDSVFGRGIVSSYSESSRVLQRQKQMQTQTHTCTRTYTQIPGRGGDMMEQWHVFHVKKVPKLRGCGHESQIICTRL